MRCVVLCVLRFSRIRKGRSLAAYPHEAEGRRSYEGRRLARCLLAGIASVDLTPRNGSARPQCVVTQCHPAVGPVITCGKVLHSIKRGRNSGRGWMPGPRSAIEAA